MSNQTQIKMVKCPSCQKEWIPDDTLSCITCEPVIRTELDLTDLYLSAEQLKDGHKETLKLNKHILESTILVLENIIQEI